MIIPQISYFRLEHRFNHGLTLIFSFVFQFSTDAPLIMKSAVHLIHHFIPTHTVYGPIKFLSKLFSANATRDILEWQVYSDV